MHSVIEVWRNQQWFRETLLIGPSRCHYGPNVKASRIRYSDVLIVVLFFIALSVWLPACDKIAYLSQPFLVLTVFVLIFCSYGSSDVQFHWRLWDVCTIRYPVFFIVDVVYHCINVLITAAEPVYMTPALDGGCERQSKLKVVLSCVCTLERFSFLILGSKKYTAGLYRR